MDNKCCGNCAHWVPSEDLDPYVPSSVQGLLGIDSEGRLDFNTVDYSVIEGAKGFCRRGCSTHKEVSLKFQRHRKFCLRNRAIQLVTSCLPQSALSSMTSILSPATRKFDCRGWQTAEEAQHDEYFRPTHFSSGSRRHRDNLWD